MSMPASWNDYKITRFYEAARLLMMDTTRTSTPPRIAAALGAALATAGSILAFIFLNQPFSTNPVDMLGSYAYYTDLNITNRLTGIGLFMLVSMLSFVAFAVFFFTMQVRENEALSRVGYSLMPSLVWLASIIQTPQFTIDPFWLYLSTGLCWLALLSFLLEKSNQTTDHSTSILLVSFGLSFFVAPALLAFVKSPMFWRLPVLPAAQRGLDTILVLGGWLQRLQSLPPLIVLLVYVLFRRRALLLQLALYPVQLALLFFFCLILPGAFLVNGVLTRFFPAAPAQFVIVLPLIIVGIWDCTRRSLLSKGSPFSPFPFLALLIYTFLQINPVPGFSHNNIFEFGARFPAFWVSFRGWAVLFKDVQTPYGLWDYAQFLFGWLFAGSHTAAVSTYGVHLFTAFILILEFIALASLLPAGLAFVLALVAGVGPQSVVLIYLCILLLPRLVKQPALWIAVWIMLSAFIPFARFPQGAICVFASLPGFLWQTARLFRQNRKTFWQMAGLFGAVALAMVIWPFGEYFWGLLGFFSDAARVNAAWTANAWVVASAPLLDVIQGNALLIMPVASLLAALLILKRGRRKSRSYVALCLCSFVLLYAFASVSYGFSRTDSVPFARQYQVLLTILLPLLAGTMAYVRSRTVLVGCLGVLLSFFALTPTTIVSPVAFLQTARSLPVLGPDEIQDAGKFGLPNLGVGRFPPGYLAEEGVLKKALRRALSPHETFLNLTMDGLHYFSSQRRMITEQVNYYDYSSEVPQLRDVQKLQNNNVVVSLLEPTSYDYSPLPLRAYYLYRYALLKGLPWEITSQKTLLLPTEYFLKMGLAPPNAAQTLQLLDKQFPLTDFSYLPSVWGRGFPEFSRDLRLVRELTNVQGQTPSQEASMEYPLQPPFRGVDAGLLVLDVHMPANTEENAEIRWVDQALPAEINKIQFKARNGTHIVPLDASPRWLLARSIASLAVSIAPSASSQLDLGNMWQSPQEASPATPLLAQGQANCDPIAVANTLVCNKDSNAFYAIPSALVGQPLLLHVSLQVPPDAGFAQVYYRTPTTFYNEGDSAIVPLTGEQDQVYFTIPAVMTSEQLRLDPGTVAGNYVISKIEAKPYDTGVLISRAILYQRPNIDQ